MFDCECRHLAKGSIRDYRAETKFLMEFLELKQITEVEEVKAHHIRDFMKQKQDSGNTACYVNDILKACKTWFNYLVEEDYIEARRNPAAKVKYLKQPKTIIETFSTQEVKELIHYYSGCDYLEVRNKTIITLLFDTGMRCNEMIMMEPEDIKKDYIVVKHGKGNKERVVPKSPMFHVYSPPQRDLNNFPQYVTIESLSATEENSMLKRLRKNHPLGYCVGAEVLFLGSLILTSILVVFLLMLFRFDLAYADDYLLGCIQELVGVGVAVLLLKRTGKAQLLRKRGCGFFNGLLVGMYPLALLAYTLYTKILFGLPEDGTLLPLWRILSFLANMILVGIAEEFLFRGVIAETLLEHFGTSRGGIWKACLLSGLLFGCAHLTNLLSSAPLGVLMQCIFAASLGVLYAAIYFRTGNLWVTVFLHGGMDIISMLVGGLYGTESVAESVSSYDASMLLSVLVYLIPAAILLRKKKIGEVKLYFQY